MAQLCVDSYRSMQWSNMRSVFPPDFAAWGETITEQGPTEKSYSRRYVGRVGSTVYHDAARAADVPGFGSREWNQEKTRERENGSQEEPKARATCHGSRKRRACWCKCHATRCTESGAGQYPRRRCMCLSLSSTSASVFVL